MYLTASLLVIGISTILSNLPFMLNEPMQFVYMAVYGFGGGEFFCFDDDFRRSDVLISLSRYRYSSARYDCRKVRTGPPDQRPRTDDAVPRNGGGKRRNRRRIVAGRDGVLRRDLLHIGGLSGRLRAGLPGPEPGPVLGEEAGNISHVRGRKSCYFSLIPK